MKLSIYVNLRSIAWIVSEGVEVIAKGIKRVNVDFDTYYEFIAGLPVSKRTNRRNKRQARKNNWRRKSRRNSLQMYLCKMGWYNNVELSDIEQFKLRVKALNQKLEPEELGAVFMSLLRKRGYKSMRGINDNDSSDYLAIMRKHEENLLEYRSIAEYLLSCNSAKGIIFTRESYEAEFDKICAAQGINDKKLRSLLYFQRPLSRGKIAKCSLESKKKVCHYSHPDYQEFRIWRDVNNIVITDSSLDEIEITNEQRTAWAHWLMLGKNLTKAKCCKDLGIKKATGYSWMSGKQINGNMVVAALGSNNFELWQDIFSAIEDKQLAALLSKKYPDVDIDHILDIDFNSAGWGEYSHKAAMKLLPLLKEGKKLREAILDVYGEVDFTSDINLRNLVVEQHYDSFLSLVNAVKNEYTIDETAIEISHLLKAGNKSRKQMASNDRAEKKRDKTVSDYQTQLLKLHKEFGGISPYEPNKTITIDELFADYNIDHIVPKSKLFEHGYINQCLCRKDLNQQKGSLTGIEFARSLGIEDEYRLFIDNAKLSERKKRFALMESADIPDNYIESNDYITRCFAKQANYVIPNKIINKYYREWGLTIFPDNDVRNSLLRCLVLANFSDKTVEYFNNLKHLPNSSIGRYNLTQEIFTDADVVPYMPRIKYYRKTKYGYIPRHQLHDESILGRRVEKFRNAKGQIVEREFFKIRKPVSALTPAMIHKIIDGNLFRKFKQRFEDRDHAEVIAEIADSPILHNGTPVKSVSVRINANELIKLNRGYCYSSMNHRCEQPSEKVVKLFDYVNALNNNEHFNTKSLKKHDIVEYNGDYYFIIGAGSRPELRSVFELNAVGIRTNKEIISNLKLVRVNQLGIIKTEDYGAAKN